MIRVNLLPHRELKRAARQRQFTVLLAGVGILGLVSVLLVHTVISGMKDVQAGRNTYLTGEITKLDKEIEEIKKLKEQTQALLARKKVVELLQGNRAQVVHLLDQMVRQLPEGIYLKQVKQTGNAINLQGYAQSSARVSTLMRNLEASPWLEAPELIEIKAATVNGVRANEFSLNLKLTAPGGEEGDAKAGERKAPTKAAGGKP
jgi:type IV pilus assembly protein PilN